MEWIVNNYNLILLLIGVAFFMFDATVRFIVLRFVMFSCACVALVYMVRYVSFQ